MNKKRQLSASEAIELVKDGDTLALGGFVGSVVPEALERALEERYLNTGAPTNLNLVFAAGQGDGKEKAVNHLAHEGLVSHVIGGHWGLVPKLQMLVNEEKVTGHNLPQGVICQLYRDSAAGKPGTLTHVGLGTYVDPRFEGGKVNKKTLEERVILTEVAGKEYLFYPRIDASVAFIRGTTADEYGNISMEEECLFLENLAIAQLVHNCGGTVIAQVKRVVKAGDIEPHNVRIPGVFVDVIVTAQEHEHPQTFSETFNPTYLKSHSNALSQTHSFSELNIKKVIARRAALELKKEAVINYGIGLPELIAQIAHEENVSDQIIATVEPGAIGGTPAGGLSFGASAFPDAIITQDQMFDFYGGGGLDQAFLGLAEVDQYGHINVSKFGKKLVGCGGFIDITQNAKTVYFCGTFTAGQSNITITDDGLNIIQDGHISKFISNVQQITFSAETAIQNNKPVLYITERAVFRLTEDGLELVEIAPGVDLEQDILNQMGFTPKISSNLQLMNETIFSSQSMSLELLSIDKLNISMRHNR
ncbi:3-oxoacid CoA-transferase [Vibrio sp. S4M6]|uniref:acyl CoA:acetate/3-ketoacid CoA transferase n=1 Tax=Vibrio sinus TaxID=2946865 RepID=UPI00202A8235|nr:CoA-transferase [Vibrio sinus]MCL9781650.1 3-oxoacid CoA-transferase [Vibrio sinus]